MKIQEASLIRSSKFISCAVRCNHFDLKSEGTCTLETGNCLACVSIGSANSGGCSVSWYYMWLLRIAGVAQGGVGTCLGDSGGPMIRKSPTDPGSASDDLLIGITSFGRAGQCASKGFPGVFTSAGVECAAKITSVSCFNLKGQLARRESQSIWCWCLDISNNSKWCQTCMTKNMYIYIRLCVSITWGPRLRVNNMIVKHYWFILWAHHYPGFHTNLMSVLYTVALMFTYMRAPSL